MALLAIATASATAVLLWQRWNWLAFAAFAITTPQWLLWLAVGDPKALTAIAVLVVFGALNAAAAVGFEVRNHAERLRPGSAALLIVNALVLAYAGWEVLDSAVWLAALAAAHVAVGLAGDRLRRVSHELALTSLALGVVLADIAFASVADGLPVAAGFALSGAGFAALLRRSARRGDMPFALAGLGGHLLLALGHALVLETDGGTDAAPLLALAAVAAACGVSSRLVGDRLTHLPQALQGLGLATLVYLATVALDGPALTARAGRRGRHGRPRRPPHRRPLRGRRGPRGARRRRRPRDRHARAARPR